MNVEGILEHLPHRYPFMLVDRVTCIELHKRIEGYKNVSFNEPFFQGHFPGHPVMPGLLIVEAMAQLSGVLAFHSHGNKPADGSMYYLAGTDRARFKRPVVPGDRLDMATEILADRRDTMKFACTARVDGALACSAEILCVRREL